MNALVVGADLLGNIPDTPAGMGIMIAQRRLAVNPASNERNALR